MCQIRELEKQSCVPFESILNFRDLGGYPTADGCMTKKGSFYRSPGLFYISGADRDLMLTLGISCIVDLRTAGEVSREPEPFGQEDGIKVYNLPLIDSIHSGPDSLVHLSLEELYIHLADYKQDIMCEIFKTFACHVQSGACVFHCTIGKDRTGIVAALLLMLAGVADEDVAYNYAVTSTLMEPVLTRRRASMEAAGITVRNSMFTSDAKDIRSFINHIDTCYGSAERYLETIGVPRDEIAVLRGALVQKSCRKRT